MRHIIPGIILGLLVLFSGSFALGQGTQMEFGKNRVQYHQDFEQWMMYESRNFITYWYGEGRNIAESAILIAEKDYREIEKLLEHRINDKIELIVFTDITDLKQSNIGSEEVFENTGGITRIVDNKVFVHFNGSHQDLRRQIREGVGAVFLNTMLFGSNIQEIVQNAVLMHLPIWFKVGLIGFVGESWSTDLDNSLRDALLSSEYKGFEKFAAENPKLAGHSLWYFVSQNYGNSTLSNLLYFTRIHRSIENGFLYVMGGTYPMVLKSWENFYRARYVAEESGMKSIDSLSGGLDIKVKGQAKLSRMRLSPDGKKVAYVLNEEGKNKVYVEDVESGKRTLLHKGGIKNLFQSPDYNYPLIAWKPNNQELVILYEKHDVLKYKVVNLIDDSRNSIMEMPSQYQRVFFIDFINNNNAVLSAAVKGQSDIFIFRESSRQTERITRDFYDDLDLAVVNYWGRKGVLFSSNRREVNLLPRQLDTVLPASDFDLYYYDLEERGTSLIRITETPGVDEFNPIPIDSAFFSYSSNENGIRNRRLGYLKEVFSHNEKIILLKDGSEITMPEDSVLSLLDSTLIDSVTIKPVYDWKGFSYPHSNYNRNLLFQDYSPAAGKVAEAFEKDGKYLFFLNNLRVDNQLTINTTLYKKGEEMLIKRREEADPVRPLSPVNQGVITPKNEKPIELTSDFPLEKLDTGVIDVDNYLFQSDFDDVNEEPAVIMDISNDAESVIKLKKLEEVLLRPKSVIAKADKFIPSRITPYRLKFRTDYFSSQMDNSLLFGGLDSYAGNRQDYQYQMPGILLKGNFKDLFEDYEIEGGLRIPTSFNGTEYFITYENKKKRLDKIFSVYRKAIRYSDNEQSNAGRSRDVIMLGQFGLRYPFDIFRSLRMFATLRQDQVVSLSSDISSLLAPTRRVQRAGLRLEYVFDNSKDVALNIRTGSRYKFYTEVMKGFTLKLGETSNLSSREGLLGIIGLDARHYQGLDKHSILALRLAGATSFGQERILFYLGGVDRWLFPKATTENVTPVTEGEFAFQTLASNMRGFKTNIRNGSSFLLSNIELRIPFFNYFSKQLSSNFLRNFQLVGFFDIGAAWMGVSPFNQDNPLNTRIIQNPPDDPSVILKVNYFRNPVVAGYGVGARALLFGYFLRLDYARGIETRVVQDPMLYISIGTDF